MAEVETAWPCNFFLAVTVIIVVAKIVLADSSVHCFGFCFVFFL